jgi:hypothetical protein
VFSDKTVSIEFMPEFPIGLLPRLRTLICLFFFKNWAISKAPFSSI